MALTVHSIELILRSTIESFVDFNTPKRMLTLGKQNSFVTFSQYEKLCKKFNSSLFKHSVELRENRFIDTNTIFKSFNIEVFALDYSDFEGAEYIMDLNSKEIPFNDVFDIVFDGGTLEHVFDVRQVLENLNKMIKKSGLIIHLNPVNNHVDHGFYSFSPTFYEDYYRINNFNTISNYVVEYNILHSRAIWKCYKYEYDKFSKLSFGGWGRKPLLSFYCGQKKFSKTENKIPQQFSYLDQWGTINENVLSADNQLISCLKIIFKKNIKFKWLDLKIAGLISYLVYIYRYYLLKPRPDLVIFP